MMARDPLPSSDDIHRMYSDAEYHDSAYFAVAGDTVSPALRPQVEIYAQALRTLNDLVEPDTLRGRRILDVGCGNGEFLNMARKEGWQAFGVELSEELSERGRADFGLNIRNADFADAELDDERYEAITMWDFLEHVLDPVAVLRRARSLLAPDGILVIFTIDCSSLFNVTARLGYRLSGGLIRRPVELLYDERHNFYFTRQTLEALLLETGFGIRASTAHRAHLDRWLGRPAPWWLRVGGAVLDRLSVLVDRQYRQIVYCTPAQR
jgi:2-polyprenyl-3-methyl-5-hydroxy-6-metoxy-1,4-benzoquinol methylase